MRIHTPLTVLGRNFEERDLPPPWPPGDQKSELGTSSRLRPIEHIFTRIPGVDLDAHRKGENLSNATNL